MCDALIKGPSHTFRNLAWSMLAALLAEALASPALSQTVGSCSKSFVGFEGGRTAEIPLVGKRVTCAELDRLRLGLLPTNTELAAHGHLRDRLIRLQMAREEAQANLSRESREVLKGGGKVALKTTGAVWATYKAIDNCRQLSLPECAKYTATARSKTANAIDAYFDEYQTSKQLQQSSEKLIELFDKRGRELEREGADVQSKIDAFLATCQLVLDRCVVPPQPMNLP